MTELSFPNSSVSELIIRPLIILLCVVLIPVLVVIFKNILHVERSTKKETTVVIIVVILIVLIFLVAPIIPRMLYIVDLLLDKRETMQAVIPKVTSNNTGYHFRIDNTAYNISFFEDGRKKLDEHFIGELCEVEYYKLSKVVTYIKVID